MQKRIGARVVDRGDDVPLCRLCEAPLDPQAEHCETCAAAEATRGHYACVRAFMDGLRPADSAATTEPRGLTDNLSRPADILTNAAAPGRSTVLDVMVTSPNRASACGDAAQAAFAWKCSKYRGVLPQLREAGISFRPPIWTADGRPHPAVTRTMHYAAERAVARGGRTTTVEAYLRRWNHEISIAILRRRAAMTRAMLPQLAPAARRFVTGERTPVCPSWKQTARAAGWSPLGPPRPLHNAQPSAEPERAPGGVHVWWRPANPRYDFPTDKMMKTGDFRMDEMLPTGDVTMDEVKTGNLTLGGSMRLGDVTMDEIMADGATTTTATITTTTTAIRTTTP